MYALVVSKSFAPAHVSHMVAYAKLLKACGYDVDFLLDDNYRSWQEFSRVGNVLSRECSYNKYTVTIIYNASIHNAKLARKLKQSGSKVIYVFHEPTFGLKREKETFIQKIKLCIACCSSLLTVASSYAVLLASKAGHKQYMDKFKCINKNAYYFPLIYDDEKEFENNDRKYLSFLGAAIGSHNFDLYVDYMKYAYEKNIDYKFCIATKTKLDDGFLNDEIISDMIINNRLVISQGKILSNDEMNDYYASSFCVWNVYNDSTQSGVLPRAYMMGTPVLASKIGSFLEYVKPNLTGEFCSYDYNDIYKKTNLIYDNFQKYTANCRENFLHEFYYKNKVDLMKKILGEE